MHGGSMDKQKEEDEYLSLSLSPTTTLMTRHNMGALCCIVPKTCAQDI